MSKMVTIFTAAALEAKTENETNKMYVLVLFTNCFAARSLESAIRQWRRES